MASGFGTATCQIDWVLNAGTDYTFSVDGSVGTAAGGASAGYDGSVDLPLPYGVFTVVVTLTGYSTGTSLGWINMTAPGYASSNYLYLDPSSSYVAVSDGVTDDTPSFTFTGADLYVKIQRSDAGTLAKLWYVGDTEPTGWDWVSPEGSRTDPACVSFQPDTSSSFSVEDLHVYDENFNELTRCVASQFDNFQRTVASGWGDATPSGFSWALTGHASYPYSSSVSGSEGILNTDAHGYVQELVSSTGPWSSGFLMTARLKAQDTSGSGDWLSTDLFISLNGSPNLELYEGHLGVSGANSNGNAAMSWVDGSYYLVKWDYHYTDSHVRAKAWLEYDPEPSWMVDFDDGTDSTTRNEFLLRLYANNYSTQVNVDYIDFDYSGRPCYYNGSTPDLSGGRVRANLTLRLRLRGCHSLLVHGLHHECGVHAQYDAGLAGRAVPASRDGL